MNIIKIVLIILHASLFVNVLETGIKIPKTFFFCKQFVFCHQKYFLLSQKDIATELCQMFDAVSSIITRDNFQPNLNRKLNLLHQAWVYWFTDNFIFRKQSPDHQVYRDRERADYK